VSSEVFTAVFLTTLVFWDVTLHGWVSGSRRFEGLCCLLYQGSIGARRIARRNNIITVGFETVLVGLQNIRDVRPWILIVRYCDMFQLPGWSFSIMPVYN
jgi:hypothetical protein